MAVDHASAGTTAALRLLLGTVLAVTGVLAVASTAVARPQAERRLSLPGATFRIPAASPPGTVWTLNLWQKGQRLASDTGTSGVLRVIAPPAVQGMVQADVRRSASWFSGKRFALRSQGGGDGGGGGTSGGGTGSTGGGTTTTDPPPPTGAAGGSAPRPVSLVADPSEPSPALAFTGVGSSLRTLAFGGLASILLGAYLLTRRRPVTRPTLEALLRADP